MHSDLEITRAWAWLLHGTQTQVLQPAAPVDDDLDFLGTPEPVQPTLVPWVDMPTDDPRWQAATQADIPWWQAQLQAGAWQQDARLGQLDAAATRVILQALQGVALGQVVAFGPLSMLLRRALQATDAVTWQHALALIVRLQVHEAQEDLAVQIGRRAHDNPSVDALLDAQQTLGDGRCVRAMEAMLAERGSALGDHQAWRARHIVQVIRRGGRR